MPTGEVVDLVDLDIEREADVVALRLEIQIVEEMRDILLSAREVVVDAEHVVAFGEKPFAKMRAQESGPAGHQYALFLDVHRYVPS